MKENPLMVGLGEALWDLLPAGKKLGGAPANFAYMSSAFGNRGAVASRLGNDELGHEARHALTEEGLITSYLQNDDRHKTGTAGVLIGTDGQPKFSIAMPAAWDFLEWTSQWEQLSAEADVVCFGTLAQRSPQSAATIERFLQNTKPQVLRICDANLRSPFFNADTLRRSFRYANVIKLNDDELAIVSSLLNLSGAGVVELATELCDLFDLRLICITRGARGSVLIGGNQVVEHGGMKVDVADTVGAGDSFTACVAHCYLQGRPLQEISDSANRIAAWVATKVGAMPPVSQEQLQNILSNGNSSRNWAEIVEEA